MLTYRIDDACGDEHEVRPAEPVRSDAAVLCAVGSIAVDNPVSCLILLWRCSPDRGSWTYARCADRLRELGLGDVTRMAVYERCKTLAAEFPAVADIILCDSAARSVKWASRRNRADRVEKHFSRFLEQGKTTTKEHGHE